MGLDLPTGPRRAAFEAIVNIIQTDPLLSRVVRSWRVWDGTDTSPVPSVDLMPCVGLRLTSGPIERISTGTTVDLATHPSLVVETWVAGTNAGDSYDLFDVIDSVLFPADPVSLLSNRDKLWAVGVSDLIPAKDVLPENINDYTSTSIHASGAYTITLTLTQ